MCDALGNLQVYQYARQRIPTLNEFCVVCDDAHVFQNGAMLKVGIPITPINHKTSMVCQASLLYRMNSLASSLHFKLIVVTFDLLLQPSVCSRELCVFAFQTLGVMADAAESVATGAEVTLCTPKSKCCQYKDQHHNMIILFTRNISKAHLQERT